ncbi:hypothetical protein [Hamadaea tsunoensis]|uniref:hypothetical protein n=1 Tax=Hamadaea tsunoensis TaxID=53368 RepID=UPI0012FBF19E|nr:hypothetical protein [Hamadaea tsunoensis]
MDSKELVTALAATDVDPNYRVDGHLVGFTHDGTPYLDRLPDGRWCVGYIERGVEHPVRFFATENEACRYFYDDVTKPRKMPRVRTPEEVAADERHMRRWWAEREEQVGPSGD